MFKLSKIWDLLRGNFSRKELTHYLAPAVLGLFFFFLLMARLLYPYVPSYPYQWTTSTISRLGSPEGNPIGWIFFSLAMIELGLMSIPLAPYMYKKYSKIIWFAILAKLIVFFSLAMSVGLILLGAIPSFGSPAIFRILHGVNAVLAFGGGALMSLIAFFLITIHHFFKKQKVYQFSGKLITLYIVTGIVTVISFVMLGISISLIGVGLGDPYVHDPSTPLFLSMPFWEWLSFLFLLSNIVLPCYIFPEEKE